MGVANCPFYVGYSLCVQARWDGERCPFYGVAGCPLFRGFQCIEVYGDTIRTVTSVCYIVGVRRWGVSVKRGSTVDITRSGAHFNLLALLLATAYGHTN